MLLQVGHHTEDAELIEIINDYAQFEKNGGVIGDCTLRSYTEALGSPFMITAQAVYVAALRQYLVRRGEMDLEHFVHNTIS